MEEYKWLTIIYLVRPLARGSVHIRSSNISESPVIDPQYLSNTYDLQTLVEGAKFARKIAQTEPLANLLAGEYIPGLSAVQTDDEWAEYAREAMRTIFHYSGTCAMLSKEDGGVVDPGLKVWGTTNLRVVDASIVCISFPLLTLYFEATKICHNPSLTFHRFLSSWRRTRRLSLMELRKEPQILSLQIIKDCRVAVLLTRGQGSLVSDVLA